MTKNICALFFTCILLASNTAWAQLESPVTWAVTVKKEGKSAAVLSFKASLKPGWHIYSQHVKEGGPTPTTISYEASKSFSLIGASNEPKGITYYEKLFKMDLTYFENEVIFKQKVKLNNPGSTIKGKLEFMVCNARECLPPDEVEFSVTAN